MVPKYRSCGSFGIFGFSPTLLIMQIIRKSVFKGLHNHLPINAYESYLDLLKSGDNSVFTSTLMLVSSGLHNRCYAIIDEVWLSENYTKCEHQNSQCFPYELRKSFYHNSPMLVAVPVQLDQLVLGGPLLGIPNTYFWSCMYQVWML